MLRHNGSVDTHDDVPNTYDAPDTVDADADTDDDAGPGEDIIVLAKTHSGASEYTCCGSGDDDDDEPAKTGTRENRNRPNREP